MEGKETPRKEGQRGGGRREEKHWVFSLVTSGSLYPALNLSPWEHCPQLELFPSSDHGNLGVWTPGEGIAGIHTLNHCYQ